MGKVIRVNANRLEPSEVDHQSVLRQMTDARVALGRHGAGLPTKAQLAFLLDHARAREAVWTNFDRSALAGRLNQIGLPAVEVDSLAADRSIYVRRPDLGRLLCEASSSKLSQLRKEKAYDVSIIVADGLSSSAVELNAVPLINALMQRLNALNLATAPIALAAEARVALGDPVGEALGVQLTIMLVGERPGLSAADSLGAYITFAPRSGKPDSDRNCVSNIRDGGLTPEEAADIIGGLVRDMIRTGISGVELKSAVARLTGDSLAQS